MGWGGACATKPHKENTRTRRHVNDEDGVGMGRGWVGVGHALPKNIRKD